MSKPVQGELWLVECCGRIYERDQEWLNYYRVLGASVAQMDAMLATVEPQVWLEGETEKVLDEEYFELVGSPVAGEDGFYQVRRFLPLDGVSLEHSRLVRVEAIPAFLTLCVVVKDVGNDFNQVFVTDVKEADLQLAVEHGTGLWNAEVPKQAWRGFPCTVGDYFRLTLGGDYHVRDSKLTLSGMTICKIISVPQECMAVDAA